MTRNLSAIYDAQFFESYNEVQEEDIRSAADTLHLVFIPSTAIDFGCGPGMMVRRLRENLVDAWGIDGSEHAITKAHPDVRSSLMVGDITDLRATNVYDLVICTEVAEHLPADQADRLVEVLTKAVGPRGHLVFTAAPPGQGGYDHINEQPMSYWESKFSALGFEVDALHTTLLKRGWHHLKRMYFYPANVRVFHKVYPVSFDDHAGGEEPLVP